MRIPSLHSKCLVAALLGCGLLTGIFRPACIAQVQTAVSGQNNSGTTFTLKVRSDLVLTNVVVRDKKTGQIVRGLTANDFTVLENNKQQHILSFDFQSVDAVANTEGTVSGQTSLAPVLNSNGAINQAALENRRLVILMFDLTSMQVEDLDRAVAAAKNYVNHQMQPADLVALVSFGTSISVDQDFTADKQTLLRGLSRYNGNEGQGLAAGATGTTSGTADLSASYSPDESEYNYINTDLKLYAIADIARSLETINAKKSLLFFSGGLTKTGIENQASLHAAVNAAVRANMSIYSADIRGLQALPPVGDSQTASLQGNAAYNGSAVQSQLDANFDSQETLSTLSVDTGGKAFFDTNDFAPAFQRIQHDTSAYYMIGFRSTNPARDGKYRKLTIRIKRSDVKLEYRPGYYAPADFKHTTKEDRERELQEQLNSDLPATDLLVYLDAFYFRTGDGHFFVPVSLIVPGSQIPFTHNSDQEKATLDVIGVVKNHANMEVGNVRDTVKLKLSTSQQAQRKNIQYTTGFALAPGTYHLKFVVRENETGRMGSFEADITVPDYKKSAVKLSSVVLSSQNVPFTKKSTDPLVRDGVQWIPNVAHVFGENQHLYLLYEVYDPAHVGAKGKGDNSDSAPVRVMSNAEFLDGSKKIYETPLVTVNKVNLPQRDAVAFLVDVPLDKLTPGLYTCQVNVIDDASGAFSFPRLALLVRPTTNNASTGTATPGATTPAGGK
ncbi:MAG TPA: VWA domain-containing protein [Acidobacteriaceae bacterium]|nr:VWA domain-containing protein [Acidobacteriaceae bacterium]